MRQERSKWRQKQLSELGQQAASEAKLGDGKMTELAEMREEQHTLLVRAVALRIAGMYGLLECFTTLNDIFCLILLVKYQIIVTVGILFHFKSHQTKMFKS